MSTKTISLAWTGASGAPYGLKLLECLLKADYQVFLMISSAARVVLAAENDIKLSAAPEKATEQLRAIMPASGTLTVLARMSGFHHRRLAQLHQNRW